MGQNEHVNLKNLDLLDFMPKIYEVLGAKIGSHKLLMQKKIMSIKVVHTEL